VLRLEWQFGWQDLSLRSMLLVTVRANARHYIREGLADFLESVIAHARRKKQKCFILFIDLDGFKAINDTHGHATGDAVLVEMANRLSEQRRHDELLARYGGDGFMWVTAGIGETSALEPLIARLRDTFMRPVTSRGRSIRIDASVGYAVYPDDGRNMAALFEAADESMYRDKRRKTTAGTA
jgi:diguanylate cyclase (GGDEF)-like protein